MPSSALHEALIQVGAGRNLSAEQGCCAVSEIIDGGAEPAAIAAFLTALRVKGETSDELLGAVQAVRRRMTPLVLPASLRPILDTCGTGGDGANSVNISTAAAIVVAACGVRVAKHGNRSASGNSGSAEVLAELGVRIDADAVTHRRCLQDLGITFLFAPQFHPALRHAGPVRRILPFRTLFNLVGPLANPASPDAQLLGVPDRGRVELMAVTLACFLGRSATDTEGSLPPESAGLNTIPGQEASRESFRAYVVTGEGGLDEVTLSGWTETRPVHGPACMVQTWKPADFGLPEVPIAALSVSGPEDSAAKIRAMLAGESGPVRDVVLANAAAALRLVERAGTLSEGVAIAAEAIDRGDAARLLKRWAKLSHQAD